MFGRRQPRLIAKLDDISAALQHEFKLNRAEFELNREEFKRNREEHELNRAEFELNREEFKRNRKEHELNREALANHRAVTTELIRQIQDSIEENRRHSDAVVGALTDLAAEIRGWGGGAAPASS